MNTNPSETTLELRVTIQGISPLIWRNIRINSTSSLHDLHQVLCTISEWTGSQPYQFTVHGQVISLNNEFGLEARDLTLADLKLRAGETIMYSYRASKPWQLELRLLAAKTFVKGQVLPVLLGGQRSAPEEHLADVKAYLVKRRHLEYNPPITSLKLAAKAVTFVLEHNTGPDQGFMDRLDIAQAEITEYLRFTSPKLDLERINDKLQPDSGVIA